MKKRRKPELLVPAGSMEPLIAAVENGADAVYVGGRLFNARMNAGNFDDERMQQALDYAHARGVKVFVTMNTLIFDEEMEEAVEYAGFLYRAGVDALIVQDLGLGRRIHEELPDFPLHLSTQGTACDGEAVALAKELGYERVVLSRELSLAEMEAACRDGGLDIEVFVHGALCICYSGQCQMSRFYGGRSGNRGACAQPCRLPYEGVDENGKKISGHLLSPKDLCLVDRLGELIEAGVYSFKIEGRMKSPEYVAVVTRIYRKYIDEYMEKGSYHVTPEDRRELRQIFNRGGFTSGYLTGNPGEKLMSPVIPKNQGIRIGTVQSVKPGSTLVDVSCDILPDMGDGIEIRSERKAGKAISTIISYRKEPGKGVLRIGDFKEPVQVGDAVYRTSSKKQLEAARSSFRNMSLDASPESRRIGRRRGINLTLTCFDNVLRLTGTTISETGELWDSQAKKSAVLEAGPFETDAERATPKERYENALRKTGNTPFEVESLRFRGDFDIRVKASEINALRRECLAKLEEEIRFRRTLPEGFRPMEGMGESETGLPVLPDTLPRISLAALCLEADRTGRSLAEAYGNREDPEAVPFISNVTKGREDDILLHREAEIRELGQSVPILVGNLSWLHRLAGKGLRLYGDYGLNGVNRETARVLKEMGVEALCPGLERNETGELGEKRMPLMISEHDFSARELRNNKRGIHIRVEHPEYSSQSRIVPVVTERN